VSFASFRFVDTYKAILLVFFFALGAFALSRVAFFEQLAISPLVIGIVLGMLFANTFRHKLPLSWNDGILFCTKTLLRVGIILYGFRITFMQIGAMGLEGIVASILVVTLTLAFGYFFGVKVLKLDVETSLLTAAGSAICGAAAVLAVEGVLKNEPHKSAVAVGTVVLFGTLAMFVYPVVYQMGWLGFGLQEEGLYIGATIHEVAQVVGAGSALSPEVADSAIIVKMFRVMLLVPVLLILGVMFTPKSCSKHVVVIPWFAIGFIGVAGFNSLNLLPSSLVSTLTLVDTFFLTMAMSALGMETHFKKFKGVGGKAMLLALALFVWLLVGGFGIVRVCSFYM
jgi:uncharacterized integral membrane protein (TIGR00698 family)